MSFGQGYELMMGIGWQARTTDSGKAPKRGCFCFSVSVAVVFWVDTATQSSEETENGEGLREEDGEDRGKGDPSEVWLTRPEGVDKFDR